MVNRFLGRFRSKPLAKSATHHRHCWYCAKSFGLSFTSVVKNGQVLHVHFGCRAAAQARIDGPAPVDFEQLPA